MGCFNKTAFYSHLPITYGDEIILFIFIDESKKYRRDDCPIGASGGGLTPIAPPFFGEYDDYGGIKNVVDDANHKLFTDKFKMPLEKFVEILKDLSGMTVGHLKNQIEGLKNGTLSENEYHHITINDLENLLSLYESFNMDDGLSMVMGMEHKTIYNDMVFLGKKIYNESFLSRRTTIEDSFQKTIDLLNDFISIGGDSFKGFNPLTVGLDYELMKELDGIFSNDITKLLKNNEKITELARRVGNMYDYFGIQVCLHDTAYASPIDYALYKNIKTDISIYRDTFINYAYFLFSFRKTNTLFDVSPYHSQDIQYDVLVPLYNKMLRILEFQQKKFGS